MIECKLGGLFGLIGATLSAIGNSFLFWLSYIIMTIGFAYIDIQTEGII